VYDCDGYFVGPGLAELLALEGYEVSLITCLDQVGPLCTETLEGPMLRERLHQVGVRFHRCVRLLRYAEGSVIGEGEFGERFYLEADGLVLVTQRVSLGQLFDQVSAALPTAQDTDITGLYRIGDCVAPRPLADAIFDGHRLGREIDAAMPAVQKRYIREEIRVDKDPMPVFWV
jgi:dimethylamine/trimethylamine dehydrogenase